MAPSADLAFAWPSPAHAEPAQDLDAATTLDMGASLLFPWQLNSAQAAGLWTPVLRHGAIVLVCCGLLRALVGSRRAAQRRAAMSGCKAASAVAREAARSGEVDICGERTHREKVEALRRSVTEDPALGKKAAVKTRASNLIHEAWYYDAPAADDEVKDRPVYKRPDTSSLDSVISVDVAAGVIEAEPLVTMETLVEVALSNGLLPKVLPEFRGITVGGAVVGAALESSSFEHGQFIDCCESLEIVLGDGRLVTARKEDDGFEGWLFHAVSGSYGTLGWIASARISCVKLPCPASGCYVQVTYDLCDDVVSDVVAAASKSTKAAAVDKDDFIEALSLPGEPKKGLLMRGRLVSEGALGKEAKRWSPRWHGDWYSEHCLNLAATLGRRTSSSSTATPQQEALLLEDYLFRYDLGAFWMARPVAFEGIRQLLAEPQLAFLFLSASKLMRPILGWAYSTQSLLKLLHLAPQKCVARKMVIMDAYMPPKGASQLVQEVRKKVPMSTPLWLCPVRRGDERQFLSPSVVGSSADEDKSASDMLLNVGIYGRTPKQAAEGHSNDLEDAVARLGGRKMLYSQNFYDKGKFWQLYDGKRYEEARQKCAAGRFPDLFMKVCEKARGGAADKKKQRRRTWGEWLADNML
eukprot:TRINITY_DN114351_c0_g1_i1.p1 TRINITY_DN114351_c0_g1~~TRINITY_DN114351_c0_g1_i1.p1  ORF type:complete len:661 (+),score=145.88 TRINITY_DN114351_c0_g1_i1:72-1985(+)